MCVVLIKCDYIFIPQFLEYWNVHVFERNLISYLPVWNNGQSLGLLLLHPFSLLRFPKRGRAKFLIYLTNALAFDPCCSLLLSFCCSFSMLCFTLKKERVIWFFVISLIWSFCPVPVVKKTSRFQPVYLLSRVSYVASDIWDKCQIVSYVFFFYFFYLYFGSSLMKMAWCT